MSRYGAGENHPSFGKAAWNRGIPHTEEHRQKIVASLIGNQRHRGIPHTLETKAKISRPGSRNPKWRGGKFVDREGYVMIWNPGHPRAVNGRYVCEHLLIAEKALGRSLILGKEVVHHINGNKSDNRNKNLLICSKSFHYWLHARMAQLYQKEHFGGNNELIAQG